MTEAQIPWIDPPGRLELTWVDGGLRVLVGLGGVQSSVDVPDTGLAGCGPAVVSPAASESIGLWLRPWLRDSSASAQFRLVCDGGAVFDVALAQGRAGITARPAVSRDSVSCFRHDARSLLNSISMNADLVRTLAGESGTLAIIDAAQRIRASSDSLARLVTTWTEEFEAGSRCIVGPAIDGALRQAGAYRRLERRGKGTALASNLWCLAVSRLLLDWLAWIDRTVQPAARGERPSNGGLKLSFESGTVSLSLERTSLGARAEPFAILTENAAGPEPQPIEPGTLIGGMSAGFGCWQTRDTAGICFGIPES